MHLATGNGLIAAPGLARLAFIGCRRWGVNKAIAKDLAVGGLFRPHPHAQAPPAQLNEVWRWRACRPLAQPRELVRGKACGLGDADPADGDFSVLLHP